MLFFLGYVLPYLAAAAFLFGMAWRTWDWLSKPAPFPLTVSSPPAGPAGRAAAVAKELALFRSLYRGDRQLWVAAWMMHASLAVILVGHAVGIAFAAEQFRYFGASKEGSIWLSGSLGVLGGLVFAAALSALLYRRSAVAVVRQVSGAEDYFAPALLLVVAGTGLAMRLAPTDIDLASIRTYMAGLLAFHPGPLPDAWLFVVHFAAVNVLLLYFPFSKLVHLTGAIVARSLLVQPAPVYPTPAGVKRHAPPLPVREGRLP
jgi:nitrate reductase gamma subunit